jgi:hypothetical protein
MNLVLMSELAPCGWALPPPAPHFDEAIWSLVIGNVCFHHILQPDQKPNILSDHTFLFSDLLVFLSVLIICFFMAAGTRS